MSYAVSIDIPAVRTESQDNAQLHGQEAPPLRCQSGGLGTQTTESRCPVPTQVHRARVLFAEWEPADTVTSGPAVFLTP